jgi:hypothetical protein
MRKTLRVFAPVSSIVIWDFGFFDPSANFVVRRSYFAEATQHGSVTLVQDFVAAWRRKFLVRRAGGLSMGVGLLTEVSDLILITAS